LPIHFPYPLLFPLPFERGEGREEDKGLIIKNIITGG
jgi:hypothetical protein